MDSSQSIFHELLGEFAPEPSKKLSIAQSDTSFRFVHYTSLENAFSIVQNKEIWMRNLLCMNDFSEFQYGFSCWCEVYDNSIAGAKFKKLLDNIHPNLCANLHLVFNNGVKAYANRTYVFSLSEHKQQEDQFGRLSMWRAYGGNSGVAIVLNKEPFIFPSDALNAYTFPVNYSDHAGFSSQFNTMVEYLEDNVTELKIVPPHLIFGVISYLFQYFVLCTKHPGFSEEKEWRVVYTEQDENIENSVNSTALIKSIEIINGIPQFVFKIPLKNIIGKTSEASLTGIEVPEVLNKVIIGPNEYSMVARDAVLEILKSNQVPDYQKKVTVSDIPIR